MKATQIPSVGQGDWWRAASVAAVLACAWVAYYNSLTVPFLFDDHSAIVNNPTIRQLWPLGDVLSPPKHATGVIGRPLLNLSLAVNYAINGLNPAGYHLLNIIFHAISGVLLLGIVRRCLLSPILCARYGQHALLLATGVAVLWVVHPLQTESVTCIVQRSEVLGGLLCLLTLYLFLRSIGSSAALVWQFCAVLAALLGTQAKEIIVAVPVIALVLDRLFFAGSYREAWRLRWRAYVGFLASWGVLAWVIANQGGRGQSVGFGLGVSTWEYLLTQAHALTLYLKLTVWPDPLVLDYGAWVASSLAEVWPQGLFILTLVAATGLALWRGWAWAILGVWFFCILAPSSSVVPLATQTVAEHRMYLPLAALLVAAVLGLFELVKKQSQLAAATLLMIVGILTVTTWRRNEQYQTSIGIWSDTVVKMPANSRAQLNLGRAYEVAGQLGPAGAHNREGLRLNPVSHEAHYNLANVLAKAGDLPGAADHYQSSLRLRPEQPSALNNLGLVYSQLGRAAEAMENFAAAVRIDPTHAGARFNWAQELVAQKKHAEAATLLAECVETRPDYPRYRLCLAEVLLVLNRRSEALVQLHAARNLNPPDALSQLMLGRGFLAVQQPAAAITHLENAQRIQPGLAGVEKPLRLARTMVARSPLREAGP